MKYTDKFGDWKQRTVTVDRNDIVEWLMTFCPEGFELTPDDIREPFEFLERGDDEPLRLGEAWPMIRVVFGRIDENPMTHPAPTKEAR